MPFGCAQNSRLISFIKNFRARTLAPGGVKADFATIPLFLMLAFYASDAAGQDRSYFPGKLIIKYETNTRLRAIQTGKNVNPKNRVQQTLQAAGMSAMEPVRSFANHPAVQGSQSPQMQQAAGNMSRIFEVSYSSNADPGALAAKLRKLPGVEYAEPRYIRQMHFTPDDPNVNPYQDFHRFEEAWDVSRSSSDVVIAIVDGGVNYLHPDMDAKLWINTDEVNISVRGQVDQNADGTISSPEVIQYLEVNNGDYNVDGAITLTDALADGSPLLSGGDTDGNGFTDDIFGWDYWESGGVNGEILQDNNPIANPEGTDHGAHVAGIAAAETDNGGGISGAGFDARYMALKAGGIPDDPGTPDDESRAIGFGYESIMYAALEGADIINCSWGGNGFSEFENDVINFATAAGALVVAASGNASQNTVDFPAGYEETLAVGSVDPSDQISSFSNIGYNIDVFATGSDIESTSFNNEFVSKTGTSMSTPVTAGLAALIKSLHPDWSPLRIASQIRSSATPLGGRGNRQGHGKIDALRAVSTDLPGVRILSSEFEDAGGGKLGLNEDGTINVQLVNYGNATSNLVLEMQSLAGQGISLNQASQNIGALSTGDSITVDFDISISETFDLNAVPAFRLGFSDAGSDYEDFDVLQYEDILFGIVDANNITTSFGGDGTIGFTDPFAGRGGVGFIARTEGEDVRAENLLFEGGLMMEAENTVFDVIRGEDGAITKDFIPQATFSVTDERGISAQDGSTRFTFEDEAGNAAGNIRLETFAFDDPGLRNIVYLKYSITNTSPTLPLEEVYAGLFNDWDIGRNISNNRIAYSEQDSILYIADGEDQSNEPIVAVAHLGEISSALAIDNAGASGDVDVDLSDGFSDEEKSESLRAGTAQAAVSGADVSAITATGPFTINPEATLTVGFVYAFGDNVDVLRSQVESARQQAPFSVSATGVVAAEEPPDMTDLFQNFPNPFTEQTTIRFDLNEDADVRLVLYDVLGREITVLRDEQLEAREYFIPFNLQGFSLSSGVYYLRLQTNGKTETIPITYIK